MDEQATLAKLRRRVLGGLAAFRLLTPVLLKLPLTTAERAALNMRRAPAAPDTSGPALTTFVIPLVGAHQVSDWRIVDDALSGTIDALRAQTDPNWRVFICSQTRPTVADTDTRVVHLPFTQKIEGHDKVAKLAQLIQYALVDDPAPGTFMPLDGDDLLRCNFVETASACADGVLVSSGYILDAGSGAIGRTEKRSFSEPLQKPFWKFCGSCMALPTGRVAPQTEANFWFGLTQHEHRLYPYLAKLAGFNPVHTREPMAIYVINHGENFETRRGRGGFKQRFTKRFQITDPDTLARLDLEFPANAPLPGSISQRKADL